MHVIHSGQKVMQLTLSDYRIRLIDSLNFLQMPLSKFPETFGLDLTTYSKGDEFIAWHDNLVKSNYIFDFQKEMYTYCAQDVTILRLCCVDFHKTFLSETSVDPFCYCTIAALVMAVLPF